MAPTHAQLVLQLLRLSRAQFDMRCAEDLTTDLEKLHDNISPRAYGLLAGVVVSYSRPFRAGKGSPYGPLEAKWSKFPERGDLALTHARMLAVRDTLLAHNDISAHRGTLVVPGFVDGRAVVAEERSPVDATGIRIARELFSFQHNRFESAARELLERLEQELDWKREVNLDVELARLRAET